ncbi:MAG: phosphoribosylformylglycinamidine synthase subunit PurL [Planctomycetes bacterium]|nr:phosphoribosylformylglycinamidine synthase subunit PurL [Planctomycetota bacterium]
MTCQIEITPKTESVDPWARGLLDQARELGMSGISRLQSCQVFVIQGLRDKGEAERAARHLLADPLTEDYRIDSSLLVEGAGRRVLQVLRRPGVMDPAEASVLKALHDMGLAATRVRTAKKLLIEGEFTDESIRLFAAKFLANEVIEEIVLGNAPLALPSEGRDNPLRLRTVTLLEADDSTLMMTSRSGCLSLNLEEMRRIQSYYREQRREPTDVELETLAQTWSEHCVHKTLKGDIRFRGGNIHNLLRSTIFQATQELNKPWCVSVFVDNAGVIEFDDRFDVCFKVETHNHPSAIEPYGGASTGVGGVIRDCLGTGLGAKPILNTDVFCFAPPDVPEADVPKGALHPKRVLKGVVSGVRDYGNRMGIPTANGAIFFDRRYIGNPLVYCGNVGLIPRSCRRKDVQAGDAIVVAGGRTGRDGIHGATFSSAGLTEESEKTSSGAVQIGDAITQKKLMDVLLQARDRGLYRCITDCGAGGLSSAVGEMGRSTGVEVDLERVPLKYAGLSYTEIWISEAQERMVLAVPPDKETEFHALLRSEEVESTTIGRFTGQGDLHLRYGGRTVGRLDMKFLHGGIPRLQREALWTPPEHPDPEMPLKADYGEDLRRILGSWNVCSKEWVIRQYDHEVQGGSVLKPLVGACNDGPGDACVLAPVLGSTRGLIVSNGMSPRYGDLDPYAMAASAIDEALRQIIAAGGRLERVALLDNFCWGNTDKPDRLGSLVLAAQACHDMSLAFGTPFISGKDSLNNEFQNGDVSLAIPPSLLISAIAVIEDVRQAVSMDAKSPGNLFYLVGLTRHELGGSQYYGLYEQLGRSVPQVEPQQARAVMNAVSAATAAGLVRACHDCSEGGLAVAAAEMAFAGGLGLKISLDAVPAAGPLRSEALLFSESTSRFVVEVKPEHRAAFERCVREVPFGCLGVVTADPVLEISGPSREVLIREPLLTLKEAWQRPLRW